MADSFSERPNMDSGGQTELSDRQQQFIMALLATGSRAEACELAGVTLRTGRRWVNDPGVKAALCEAHSGALRETAQRLAGRCTESVAVLIEVMRDKAQPGSTRRLAAGAILDAALRFRDHVDFTARLDAIEAQLATLTKG